MTSMAAEAVVARLRRLLAIAVALLALAAPATAASYTSSGPGNWDNAATWGGAGIPGASDTVSIGNHAISLNGSNRACASLTFTDNGSITGANTLTLTGQLAVTASAAPTISCSTLAWGTNLADIASTSTGNLSISAAITGTSGLTKSGSGLIALSGACTYSGTTSISAGTLRISGASGAIASSAQINVEVGATLDIDNTSTSTDRFSDTGTLAMRGGTFSWTTNNTRSESIKYMSFTKGHSVIAFNAVTGSPTLTVTDATAAVTRSNWATMEFNRGASPYGIIKWTSAAAPVVIPGLQRWVEVLQGGFGQTGYYDTTNGVVQPTSGTQYSIAVDGAWTTNTNWSPNGIPGSADHVGTATTVSTSTGTIGLGAYRLFLDGAGTTTLNGAIGGSDGVTKLGTGTATLAGANGYTGTTIVSDGTLIVSGAQSASAVSLAAGTLRGSGTVGAVSGASGTIADIQPGASGACGSLKAASVDLSAGVTLRLRVTGYSAGQFDVLDAGTASGALTLGGTSRLVIDLSSLASTGTVTGALTCASRTGTFNRVDIVNNPNRYDVVVVYGATRVDIKIRPRRNGNVGVFKAPSF